MTELTESEVSRMAAIEHELRLLREQLHGFHDTLHQFVSKSAFAAPEFVFAGPEPSLVDPLISHIDRLASEFGATCVADLKSARRYSEAFLMNSIEADEDDFRLNLETLKLAIQCEQNHSELQRQLFAAYQQEFVRHYEASVDSCTRITAGAQLVVVHASCRARAHLARESASTFVLEGRSIANIIVVGHGAGRGGQFSFDQASNVLVVPASDSYEGLATKVALAYHFLSMCGITCPVMKVDDDMRCLQPDRLMWEVIPLAQSHHYAGRVWHAHLGFSRTWHFNKCEDQSLNTRPYSLLANATYAEGPCYILSARALNVLGKGAVCAERLFESEFSYEDLAVGKVLNHYGIRPLNYDFLAHRILASTDTWMMERAGLSSDG